MKETIDERATMDRVKTRAPEIAKELGLTLKRCAWGQTDADFTNDRWSLVLKTDGAREVVRFDADSLIDPDQWEVIELVVRRALEQMR